MGEDGGGGGWGDPVGALRRRYLGTLIGVAVLLVVNQLLVQPPLLRLMTDAPVINLAGRQRMLSQRLAKAALSLDRADSDASRRGPLGELAEVIPAWSATHRGLQVGDPSRSLPGRNGSEVSAAFMALEPAFSRMHAAAERLEQGGRADPASVRVILESERDYLLRMDRIVGMYEREARARVEHLRWTGWALSGLSLAALAGLGGYVLEPAARIIRRQFAALRQARETLEDRVRERTEQLERAGRDLDREARERSLAEARHRVLLEQFSHVARTETIGQMASGLAHELNQPLGAIANYAEGCLVTLEGPNPALGEIRATLEKILDSSLRAGKIIRGIRAFVTRHGPTLEPFAANVVVEEVEALFRDEARRLGIDLRRTLAPELPCLVGDPVQIQQVLVNLVRNAFEALGEAGTPDASVVLETLPGPDGGVGFAVTDNGGGIAQEQSAQIFDAFFSTRARGMGMGLAISRTLVEAHHGRLDVECDPGTRTTFRFNLPPAAVGDANAAIDGLRGG